MRQIFVCCYHCGQDCAADYVLRGPAGHPYHLTCPSWEPPMPPADPMAGRGYYEEDAEGYDEAS